MDVYTHIYVCMYYVCMYTCIYSTCIYVCMYLLDINYHNML